MSADYPLSGVPLVESPFFDDIAESLPADSRGIGTDLNRQGYAVFDFPDDRLEEKIDGIKRDLCDRYDWGAWRAGRCKDLRIQDAWRDDERVRSIAVNDRVLSLLSTLYGRQAFPFQTLNFAVGSQQAAHCDYLHFNSIPERFMCGVWLAMEDVDEDNGPLFYYPGSHRWPAFQNEHLGVSHSQITADFPDYVRYVDLWQMLIQKQGVERETFHARKGQALIWTANLIHGGSVQKDLSRTRWSQVTHYYFEDCGYTTPLANDVYQGKIMFRDVVDVRTGGIMPNVISGVPVSKAFREAARPKLAKSLGQSVKASAVAVKRMLSRYRRHPDIPDGFDPDFYLRAHPDLAAAGVDPYRHYVLFGKAEGRRYKVG